MATVRMTKDLVKKIMTKLELQFHTRREALKHHINLGFAPLEESYKETLLEVVLDTWGMPRDVYDAIPDGWCHRVTSLRATSLNSVDTTRTLPSVRYDPSLKVPAELQYAHDILRLEDGRFEMFAEYARDSNLKLKELADEESDVKVEAHRLLNGCGSLKQALDAWPHLMSLLPDDVVREHHREPEKRSKAAPVKINADILTSAVVKGKMAESLRDRDD